MYGRKEIDDSNDDSPVIIPEELVSSYYAGAYYPSLVNVILLSSVYEQLKHDLHQLKHVGEDVTVFTLLETKIALFDTCYYPISFPKQEPSQPKSKQKLEELKNIFSIPPNQTLRDRLQRFNNKEFNCELLIIPIAEVARKHFRLLVIYPHLNKGIFYDSKSLFCSMPSELMVAAGPALLIRITAPKDFSIRENFLQNYYYISTECNQLFPGIQIEESHLGHQDINNHIDCGPHIVSYAIDIMQKRDPSLSKRCIVELRAEQGEIRKIFRKELKKVLRQRDVLDFIPNPSRFSSAMISKLLPSPAEAYSQSASSEAFPDDATKAFCELAALSQAHSFFSPKFRKENPELCQQNLRRFKSGITAF